MNKAFTVAIIVLSLTGCMSSQPVIYAHKDGTDWLTKESRGNNLDDYASLKKQGEQMCADRGKKLGVDIFYSGPGGSMNGNNFSSYTIGYKCKEDESKVAETAKEWFNKAAEKLKEASEKAQEKVQEIQAAEK